ncbi:MAG TPA: nickel-binding protein [Gaiellaceae bacterium]|nr:nickel-binding protein [Gaiellaceae bacterium]
MATYLAELYFPDRGGGARAPLAARANAAAEELSREGIGVHYVRSVFVPEDETCFCFFEAPSADSVREALVRAALDAVIVVEAYVSP